MTTASLERPQSRRRFIVGVSLAGALCLLALALLMFPSEFHTQTREYRGRNNSRPIASFTLNAFVAQYHQDSKPFDPSSPEAAAMPYKGFTTVNTVEWSVQPRRVAAVLAVVAVLLILRIARRHRLSTS